MTVSELTAELRAMYQNASPGEAVCMIHLFGIKFANEIRECSATPNDIAKSAANHESYGTEISKGVRLARYVQIK